MLPRLVDGILSPKNTNPLEVFFAQDFVSTLGLPQDLLDSFGLTKRFLSSLCVIVTRPYAYEAIRMAHSIPNTVEAFYIRRNSGFACIVVSGKPRNFPHLHHLVLHEALHAIYDKQYPATMDDQILSPKSLLYLQLVDWLAMWHPSEIFATAGEMIAFLFCHPRASLEKFLQFKTFKAAWQTAVMPYEIIIGGSLSSAPIMWSFVWDALAEAQGNLVDKAKALHTEIIPKVLARFIEGPLCCAIKTWRYATEDSSPQPEPLLSLSHLVSWGLLLSYKHKKLIAETWEDPCPMPTYEWMPSIFGKKKKHKIRKGGFCNGKPQV